MVTKPTFYFYWPTNPIASGKYPSMHENCHHNKIIYKSDLKMFCRIVMHYQYANTALVKMNKCKYKCFPRFSFASPLLLLSWENYLNGDLNKIKNWVYHQCKIIFTLDVLKQVQESWAHFRMPLDHKLTFNNHIGNVLVKKIYIFTFTKCYQGNAVAGET